MKNSDRQKVLICNDTKFFELFHEFLCHTLEELGCEAKVSRNWDEFIEELEKEKSKYSMTVIDPQITGFDLKKLKELIHSENAASIPSIGIRPHPGSSIQGVVQELGMKATVCKTYPPQDMAFVFNRLLFPQDNDKRAHPRALTALNVEYQMSNFDSWFFEDTFNVSTGGVFLRSYRQNEAGSEIRMKIYLPNESEPLECRGKVVHMRPHVHSETSLFPSGLGVQFTSVGSKDLERLQTHIQSKLLPIDQESNN